MNINLDEEKEIDRNVSGKHAKMNRNQSGKVGKGKNVSEVIGINEN